MTLFTGVLVLTKVALAVFALVAGGLAATGTFFSRLIFSGEAVSRAVLDESLEQEKLSRQSKLSMSWTKGFGWIKIRGLRRP